MSKSQVFSIGASNPNVSEYPTQIFNPSQYNISLLLALNESEDNRSNLFIPSPNVSETQYNSVRTILNHSKIGVLSKMNKIENQEVQFESIII